MFANTAFSFVALREAVYLENSSHVASERSTHSCSISYSSPAFALARGRQSSSARGRRHRGGSLSFSSLAAGFVGGEAVSWKGGMLSKHPSLMLLRRGMVTSSRRRQTPFIVSKALDEQIEHGDGADSSNMSGPLIHTALTPRQAAAKMRSPRISMNKGQVVNIFTAQLREYRTLKADIQLWSAAFEENEGRKPNLADVEATGDASLIAKYKQYVVLRDRVTADTKSLRSTLENARPESSADAKLNINKLAASSSPAQHQLPSISPMGARLASAFAYKDKRQQQLKQAALPDQDAQLLTSQKDDEGVLATPKVSKQPESRAAAPATLPLKYMLAPPRVRKAMQAALEYKRSLAATKAKPAEVRDHPFHSATHVEHVDEQQQGHVPQQTTLLANAATPAVVEPMVERGRTPIFRRCPPSTPLLQQDNRSGEEANEDLRLATAYSQDASHNGAQPHHGAKPAGGLPSDADMRSASGVGGSDGGSGMGMCAVANGAVGGVGMAGGLDASVSAPIEVGQAGGSGDVLPVSTSRGLQPLVAVCGQQDADDTCSMSEVELAGSGSGTLGGNGNACPVNPPPGFEALAAVRGQQDAVGAGDMRPVSEVQRSMQEALQAMKEVELELTEEMAAA